MFLVVVKQKNLEKHIQRWSMVILREIRKILLKFKNEICSAQNVENMFHLMRNVLVKKEFSYFYCDDS